MTHKFRMVSPNLDKSDKWHNLPDDGCRLGYDWLLWCRHSSPTGVYPMPAMYMAHGLRCTLELATERLAAIEQVGLIETGPDDLIRMVGYFKSAGKANSPTTFTMHCRMFGDRAEIPDCDIRSRALWEMVYYNCEIADRFNKTKPHFAQAHNELQTLINAEVQRVPKITSRAINHLGLYHLPTIRNSLWSTVRATIEARLQDSIDTPPGTEKLI